MDYVFIHSTVMEYLAAHFIIQKLIDPNYLDYVFPCPNLFQNLESRKQAFFESEVLPIAVGSSIENGASIIRFLGRHIQVVKKKSEIVKLYQLSIKCLAEYENYIDRHYKLKRLKLLHKEMEKSITTHLKDVDWVYRTLKRIILKSDEKQIKFWEATLKSISKLSRQYFFDNYLEYDEFVSNNSYIFKTRQSLLYTLIDLDLVNQWIHKHQEENVRSDGKYLEKIGDNLLTLNTKGYHPEDRNYFYYFKNSGEGLVGILGSPNFLHMDAITCITYNPSGQLIASGSKDSIIRVWDADTGKEIQAFKGHLDIITSIIFSPDWEYLLSGSSDNTIRLWKTFYGKELRCIKGHKGDVTCLKYFPDGMRVVSSSKDHTIKIWDVDEKLELFALEGHQAPVYSISISPDGNRIISGSGDRSIKLWDVNDRKEIYTFKGHKDVVRSVCFSPDGKHFLSGSADRTIGLWETTSRKLLCLFKKHSNEVIHVAFNSMGDQCLSFSLDGNIKLWSFITGKEILNYRGQRRPFRAANISPNGHRIVSGDDDGHINLWSTKDGSRMRIFRGHRSPVTSIDFSPNGRQLVSGSKDSKIILWDTENGKEIRVMDGHNAPVTCVKFSPSCNYILSGSQDATIKLWTTHNGKEVREFCGHTDSIRCVDFRAIGSHIITASNDKTVKMWDLKKGLIYTFEGYDAPISYLKFNENGRNIVSVSEDNIIKIWDVSSGKKVKVYKGPCDHAGYIYIPDEDKAVYSNLTDYSINFWDLSSGRIVKTFTGHTSKVTGIKAWKQYLISVSQDCTLKIWDIPSRQLVISVPLVWPPSDLKQHTTNKNIFATANANGIVTFFDIQKVLDKRHLGIYHSPHDRFIIRDNRYKRFGFFNYRQESDLDEITFENNDDSGLQELKLLEILDLEDI
ncbi:MAG: hypothetical protein JSV88_29675 [Candidatus Aminicenantes bacterium]|nr:MAG: hypothetical protein JSV88_29675 [Candidatus Aminicenantes bacterium]